MQKLEIQLINKKLIYEEIINFLVSLKTGKRSDIEKELPFISEHLSQRKLSEFLRKKTFTFIDLFAGIGGMRLGFEAVGGECVLTSENDPKAQATYFCNFGDKISADYADITKIKEETIPDFDILLGGFPCQAFSVAGERRGFQDTRGSLFFDIQRIISTKRPKAFLLENVKGLIGHDQGKTFSTIMRILEEVLDYKVFTKVLNTMEYGNIPQTRERIYLVGFDNKRFKNRINFSFPEKIELQNEISNMFEKGVQDKTLYYDKSPLFKELKNKITKTDTIYQWRRIYVRENKNKVCPTLTANMGTGGHNVPLIKEKSTGLIRKLGPRECANFQGFPADFYIPHFMPKSHLYKQFGNAVSVPVVQRIAHNMVEALSLADKKII